MNPSMTWYKQPEGSDLVAPAGIDLPPGGEK